MALALAAAAVLALVVAWRMSRGRERLADTPRSRCAAVFVGFNEVSGHVEAVELSPAHFTNTPSAWWSATLEQERRHTRVVTTTDSKGNTHTRTETYYEWHVIEQWASPTTRLFVTDESGTVLLDVATASVEVPFGHDLITGERPWFTVSSGFGAGFGGDPTGRYRERERRLCPGDVVFCAGHARIDDTGAGLIVDGSGGEEFLVTTSSESSVQSRRRWGTWVAIVVAVAAGGAAGYAATEGSVGATVLGAAAVAVAVVVLGTVRLYNRLCKVKQLQDRAESLIDVQLERRAVLIPQLVAVAAAYAAHERSAQSMVATLRAGASSSSLAALAEAYPELRADAVFARVFAELVATENRVCGAREYFNDAVTIVRDRVSTFPGVLLAGAFRSGRFGASELLAVDAFDAVVPTVDLDRPSGPR